MLGDSLCLRQPTNCWRQSRSDAKICTVSPLLAWFKLNNHWILCRWLTTFEGIITSPFEGYPPIKWVYSHKMAEYFLLRIYYWVYNSTNSISGNQYKAVSILFHCAMFRIMRSINYTGFWCYLSWKVLAKLHGSFQQNRESGFNPLSMAIWMHIIFHVLYFHIVVCVLL